MSIFAQRLKGLREEAGLTQEELAKKLKVSRSTLGSWEVGNRTPELNTAIKISNYFNVQLDYFWGETDSKTEKTRNEALLDSLKPFIEHRENTIMLLPKAATALKRALYDFMGEHNISLDLTYKGIIEFASSLSEGFMESRFNDCIFHATELLDELGIFIDKLPPDEKDLALIECGRVIRELRGNESLLDFAKKCGVNSNYLASVEAGYDETLKVSPYPSFYFMCKVAEVVSVPLGELLSKVKIYDANILDFLKRDSVKSNPDLLYQLIKCDFPDLSQDHLQSLNAYASQLQSIQKNEIDLTNESEETQMAIARAALSPDHDAEELAAQIKKLPPEKQEIIKQLMKSWQL